MAESGAHFLGCGIDLANHAVASKMNATVVIDEIGSCRLVSTRQIASGEEVLICYDAEMDFLDTFERYGFLDLKSDIHSVTIKIDYDKHEHLTEEVSPAIE